MRKSGTRFCVTYFMIQISLFWTGSFASAFDLKNYPGPHFAPTYGAEFEFINAKMRRHWRAADWHQVVGRERVKLLQKGYSDLKDPSDLDVCSRALFTRAKVEIPGTHWSFFVSSDYGVVEVQTQPATSSYLRRILNYGQEFIFDRIESCGFYPNAELGFGQFNVGAESAFPGLTDDPMALWAFFSVFIDFHNHNELSCGVWGKCNYNAPSFIRFWKPEITQLRIKGIRAIQSEFLKGKIKTYQQLRDLIKKQLKYHFYDDKFESLRLPKDANDTIEYRAVDAQLNFEQFVLMAELFELRFRFLQRRGFPHDFFVVSDRISPQEKLDRFYLYVTEAGGDWSVFSKLVSSKFPDLAPSEIFLKPVPLWNRSDFDRLRKYEKMRTQFETVEKLWSLAFGNREKVWTCEDEILGSDRGNKNRSR